MEQKESKPRWKSKTYWVNFLIGLLALVEVKLNMLQPLLSVDIYQLTAFVLVLVNFALRELTTGPVGGRV